MIVKNFIGSDKQRAIRKALNYWYKNFVDNCTMVEFFSRCVWKKEGVNFIVIYRGPAPEDK